MADPQKLVRGWLDDVGVAYSEGGVTGPAVAWSTSMAFGGSTHVSVAYDTRHPKRIEVLSDLLIAEDHQKGYAKLTRVEREVFDRRIVQVFLGRPALSFYITRSAKGVIEQVAMRAFLPLEGLTPLALLGAIYDARNATMDLRVRIQESMGPGTGVTLDRALTDPGYANIVLERGTLETLDAFQIPGETLDETILRAVRE